MLTRCVLGVVVAAALVSGCSQGSADPPERTAAAAAPATTNDLARNSAHRTATVPGESFVLAVDYYLTAYDAAKWRTLAAKDVSVSAYARPTGGRAAPAVVLGSFEARAELRAVDPALDALPVATMTDRPPAALPGYQVSAAYPYTAVLPAGGYGPALVERWTYLAGSQALTDEGLARAGVYATRLVFSYGLLVRSGDGYHKRSVTDSLTVPVATA